MTKLTIATATAKIVEVLGSANEVTIVSTDAVDIRDGSKYLGKKITVVLEGAGVGDPTRRYYLRNTRMKKITEGGEIFAKAPKKARGTNQYIIEFALNQNVLDYTPPAPVKEDKPEVKDEAPEVVEGAEVVGETDQGDGGSDGIEAAEPVEMEDIQPELEAEAEGDGGSEIVEQEVNAEVEPAAEVEQELEAA
jgi:hypothetical protein